MKLNKHNTALHFLDEREPMNFGLAYTPWMTGTHAHIMGARIRDAFPILRKRCQTGKVQYISDPFEEAYDRAKDRLTLNMRGEGHGEQLIQSGVFVFRVKGGDGKNTIFYSVDAGPEPNGDYRIKGSIMAFCSLKHAPGPSLFACYFRDRGGEQVNFFSGDKKQNAGGGFDIFIDMMYLCLFLRYCEIETKVVQPGRKGEHVGTKYLNETKSPVEIMDSTWFTTIIRSEGFGVKGHFRLQPYGPGLTQKKLIYIAPFEKHGYTRKAKVLTINPTEHEQVDRTGSDPVSSPDEKRG